MSQQSNRRNALLGVAFMMPTSAIEPSFLLTQTVMFTQKLVAGLVL